MDDELCPLDFQKKQGAPFIIVATHDIAACAKRCRSMLQALEPPISVPVVAVSASHATKMLEEMSQDVNTEMVTCGLKIKMGGVDHECSICGETMDKVVMLPACKHFLHERCAEKWLVKSPSCPLCSATG